MDYMVDDRKRVVPDLVDEMPYGVCRSAALTVAERFGGDVRALVDVLDTLGLRERLGHEPH